MTRDLKEIITDQHFSYENNAIELWNALSKEGLVEAGFATPEAINTAILKYCADNPHYMALLSHEILSSTLQTNKEQIVELLEQNPMITNMMLNKQQSYASQISQANPQNISSNPSENIMQNGGNLITPLLGIIAINNILELSPHYTPPKITPEREQEIMEDIENIQQAIESRNNYSAPTNLGTNALIPLSTQQIETIIQQVQKLHEVPNLEDLSLESSNVIRTHFNHCSSTEGYYVGIKEPQFTEPTAAVNANLNFGMNIT